MIDDEKKGAAEAAPGSQVVMTLRAWGLASEGWAEILPAIF